MSRHREKSGSLLLAVRSDHVMLKRVYAATDDVTIERSLDRTENVFCSYKL